MPYESEHSCRLKPPENFDKFRRGTRKHNGKEYSIIFGLPKGKEGWEEQAYRYNKTIWTATEAAKHCKDHDGSFEPAIGKELTFVCKSCGETLTLTQPADVTEPGAEPLNVEPDEVHSAAETGKGVFSPLIEGLEEKWATRKRVLGRTIDTLEKS